MKIIILLVLISFPFSSFSSGRDSLGVFYTPRKVTVFAGEINGPKRLNLLMDSAGADTRLHILSNDKSFEIKCVRKDQAASCNFVFLKSSFVKISPKKVEMKLPLKELSLELHDKFEINFESSNGDTFSMEAKDVILIVKASKKD